MENEDNTSIYCSLSSRLVQSNTYILKLKLNITYHTLKPLVPNKQQSISIIPLSSSSRYIVVVVVVVVPVFFSTSSSFENN